MIDGTGSGAGIDNEAGHDGVRIVRGTVRDFQFGVHLFQTSGGRVERISARSNMIGLVVARSADVQLDSVQATANVTNGIDVTFSERVTVRRSTAAGNGLSGIVDRFTEASTYTRNTVTGNSSPGLVLNGSDGVVAQRNHAAANDSDGIELTLRRGRGRRPQHRDSEQRQRHRRGSGGQLPDPQPGRRQPGCRHRRPRRDDRRGTQPRHGQPRR